MKCDDGFGNFELDSGMHNLLTPVCGWNYVLNRRVWVPRLIRISYNFHLEAVSQYRTFEQWSLD